VDYSFGWVSRLNVPGGGADGPLPCSTWRAYYGFVRGREPLGRERLGLRRDLSGWKPLAGQSRKEWDSECTT